MKPFLGFNREQLTLGAAVTLSAALVVLLWGDGLPPEVRPAQASERIYAGPPTASAEFAQDSFQIYWEGRDIFSAALLDKLEVPRIAAPTPRPEALVLPPLRPGMGFEALNRSTVAVKYRTLDLAAPSVPTADFLTDEELAELKGLGEPEAPFVEDRRALRMREWDVLHLTEGRKPMEGRILLELPKGIDFQSKNKEFRGIIERKEIMVDRKTGELMIDRSWTFEEEHRYRVGRLRAGDAAGRFRLAEWSREQGMLPEAKAAYREAIEILRGRSEFKNEFFDGVAALGQLLRETGDFDGVLDLYGSVTQWTPFERPEMLGQIGDVYRAIGLTEAAYETYRSSLEASPRFFRGRALLARMLYELGRDREAADAVEDFFSKYLDSIPPADRAEAGVARGLALLRSGDLAGAEESLQDAAKADPKNAEALNAIGVLRVLNGKTREGVAQFLAALRANQYLTDAWLNLAGLALAAGRADDADALYAGAVQRDPACAEAVAGQALVFVAKDQPKEAVTRLEGALDIEPGSFYARYAYGYLKDREGASEEALDGFEGALQSEFHFIPAYSGAAATFVAEAAALEGDTGADAVTQTINRERAAEERVKARTLLESVRAMDPNRASIHAALACVLTAQGRGVEADVEFQRAMDLCKAADPFLAYGRGYVAYWLGDGDAKQRLEAARAVFAQGAQIPGANAADQEWIARCDETVKKITEWLDTSVLLFDRFERGAGDTVGGGWIERDKEFGVRIALEQGRARFSGKQAVKDMGLTQMEREVPRQDFLSFEVTLYPEAGKCETGVSLYYAQQSAQQWTGLHVGVDMGGRLRFLMTGNTEFAGGRLDYFGTEATKVTIPDPKEIRFLVRRRAGQRGTYVMEVLIWNPAASEWVTVTPPNGLAVQMVTSNPSYKIAVWARSTVGQEFAVSVDNARVLLKRQNP